ncbi:MAG: molybdopterin-dependent oxidoreductase [Halomonas sp.]|nr:molybdopterin-dependent oxidoreductase [Halomonas sp.]TVM06811.1 MAG: molybdopterin-dependent oxidoreductase [Halomonas sp.]
MKRHALIVTVWVACVLLMSVANVAHALSAPEGRVILKISGNIARTNVGEEAHFDFSMLADLSQHQYRTGTPWTRQPHEYSGPLMRDLLSYLQAASEQVRVSALNGYEAYIPTRDFTEHDVMLALKRDGQPITIREYGPLWVLYPFDHNAELLSETFRSRAVWQVMKIDVR